MSTQPTAASTRDAYTAAQAEQDAAARVTTRRFQIWRGDAGNGAFVEYQQEVVEGMVVLDAVHEIQAHQANDLAVRWNCKAGKCVPGPAEINGSQRLLFRPGLGARAPPKPVTIEPMRAFPH